MDLVIGQHCSVAACNVRDLLPIECSCQKFFCRNHISLEEHQCPGKPGVSLKGQTTTWSKRASCGMVDCNKPTLASAFDGSGSSLSNLNDGICSECKGAFCATHRHPSSHACISWNSPPPMLKNAEAKAILAKNFPAVSKPTGTRAPVASGKPPTDPVKLARFKAVELMKMRHKAVPGDSRDKTTSVPIEERLHVIAVADRANPSRTQVLWFRKNIIAGKALDLLVVRLQLSGSSLKLVQLPRGETETDTILRLDTSLGEQLEDGASLTVCP